MPVLNKKTDVFKQIDMSVGPDKCWEWQGKYNEKARNIYWSIGNRKVIPYRMVYELVHGVTLTTEQQILHSCDNRKCCNPRHMRVGTHQENMNDMKQRERHGLPHNTVRAIRRLGARVDDGGRRAMTDADIGELYGISRRHVNSILNGIVYSHVEGNEDEPSNGDVEEGEGTDPGS